MTAEQQEQIYLAYHGKVMGYLCARINRRVEAEDLCSEVFMCGFGSRMNEEGTLLIKEEETIITMQRNDSPSLPSRVLAT